MKRWLKALLIIGAGARIAFVFRHKGAHESGQGSSKDQLRHVILSAHWLHQRAHD